MVFSLNPNVAHYINIVEVIVIPYIFRFDTQVSTAIGSLFILYKINESSFQSFYYLPTNSNYSLWNTTLNGMDNTCNSIGVFTNMVSIVYNGLPRKIYVKYDCSHDNFNLYLCFDGHYYDITKSFIFEQDYSITPPNLRAQREIARKTNTLQGITGAINSASQIGVSIGTLGLGIGQSSIATENGSSMINMLGEMNTIKGVGGIINGVSNLASSINTAIMANKSKYRNFESCNNDNSAIINAIFGICYIKYPNNSIINYNEVINAIKEIGYSVDYFTNNLDLGLTINDFNIIKFNFVRVVGCSQEINNIISNMLLNGVKIWYKSSPVE